jgi:hypothetical protein
MNNQTEPNKKYDVPFTAFDVEILGEIKFQKRFKRLYPHRGRLVYEGSDANITRMTADAVLDLVYLKHDPEEGGETFKDMDSLYKSEIAVLERATESSLERVTANVVIVFGICLATGLSPWTSTLLNDATSTQLGSYAMLLSVSSGLAALLTSSSYLNNMLSAATKVVELTEAVLLWPVDRFDEDLGRPSRDYSFRRHAITLLTLWRAMDLAQKLIALLFGPMLVLLRKSCEAPNFLELKIKLGRKVLWFTTRYGVYTIYREMDEVVTGLGGAENETEEEPSFPTLPTNGVKRCMGRTR